MEPRFVVEMTQTLHATDARANPPLHFDAAEVSWVRHPRLWWSSADIRKKLGQLAHVGGCFTEVRVPGKLRPRLALRQLF